MKAEITVTTKKTWIEEYPDNDFSDEIIISNFWCYTYDDNEYHKNDKVKIKRTDIDKVVIEE